MHDLNDLTYFVAVVRHGGFSAAARATGLDKTRLSRRIAALEQRLGVRLLQRNTRSVALTAAGARFFERAGLLVADAQDVFDSIADLRAAPAGTVRLSCPQAMAQSVLAPVLPGFLARYPQVRVEVDASDRHVDLVKERFDLALRAHMRIEDSAGLVAREVGHARRVLVAAPALLRRAGRPLAPDALAAMDTLARPGDIHEGKGRWTLFDGAGVPLRVEHMPRLVSDDLPLQVAATLDGIGVALLPEPLVAQRLRAGALEVVLPAWTAAAHVIHLLYPQPRGMLPAVRSLVDYLAAHLPEGFAGRG